MIEDEMVVEILSISKRKGKGSEESMPWLLLQRVQKIYQIILLGVFESVISIKTV